MKIVCTGGCFDILHGGHIRLLEEARAMGDLLIVLINNDAYLRQKGPNRPFLPLDERMAILLGLRVVSCVIPFSAATPCQMLRLIQPDIFAKGSEYAGGGIPEESVMAEWGGKVVYIDSGITTHTGHIMQKLGY